MSFWLGLVAGLIIGWLIEWIIDWQYWRRGVDQEAAAEQALRRELESARAEIRRLRDELAAAAPGKGRSLPQETPPASMPTTQE